MCQQTGVKTPEAKAGFLGQSGELHLARAPFLRHEEGLQGYSVRSPTLQKIVALDTADCAFLDRFCGLQTAGDVAALLLSGPDRIGKYQSQMGIYLGVERFRAMGLLVDTRLMSVPDLNRLVRIDPNAQSATDTADSPLAITQRMDGRWIVVHGHAAVFSAFRDQTQLRAHILSPPAALAQLASLPDEFFGSARGGIPYQSIFHQGTELVRGRRPDLHERFAKIDPADLVDKRILDLGCNVGMNCFQAAHFGARATLGLDLAAIAAAAQRLNLFFDAPCRFEAQDLNFAPEALQNFDTIFLFAVLGHLKTLEGVVSIIKRTGAKTVYVETHCNIQDQGQTEAFLNLPLFETATPLGLSFDNIVRKTRSRQFYQCRTRE